MSENQQLDPCCPVCGEKRIRFLRSLSNGYKLYSCVQCSSCFCLPFAAPVSEFYGQANDLASSSRHAGPTSWYPSHPTRYSKVFAKGKKGLLLDVGCGNGAFAEFAAGVGYQVIGIDVDVTSIEIARSRKLPGAAFHCCTLDEFNQSYSYTKKIDIVTMFEVFEHLERPVPILNAVGSLLCDGGLFIGSLPNIERLFMWQFNMDYELPPYHLTYWTMQSWSKFLQENTKFHVLCGEASIYYGYISDVLLHRYKLPRPIQTVVSKYLYPFEYKLEKYFKRGASFYFEAALNNF